MLLIELAALQVEVEVNLVPVGRVVAANAGAIAEATTKGTANNSVLRLNILV